MTETNQTPQELPGESVLVQAAYWFVGLVVPTFLLWLLPANMYPITTFFIVGWTYFVGRSRGVTLVIREIALDIITNLQSDPTLRELVKEYEIEKTKENNATKEG